MPKWQQHYADYEHLKTLCSDKALCSSVFAGTWRKELGSVSAFYRKQLAGLFRGMYARAPEPPRGWGVHRALEGLGPSAASAFSADPASPAGPIAATNKVYLRSLQEELREIKAFADLNTDTLRKSVKKFDKTRDGDWLSATLLPELCVEVRSK